MTIGPASRRVVIALAAWFVVSACAQSASGQGVAPASAPAAGDTLARAKDLYASAQYEAALQLLATFHSDEPSPEGTEVAAYEVFCLLALGQDNQARTAIATLVRLDPFYRPTEAQASPRILRVFDDVRSPLLPDIVKQEYAKAREAFTRKEMAAATAGFDRAIALLDEVPPPPASDLSDLRTLAVGFRDLSRAAAAPSPAPVRPAPSGGGRPYDATDPTVIPPVAASRALPLWRPGNPALARLTFEGAMELVIDEKGKVVSATMTKEVHPSYDSLLLKAARDWTYQPATKDGTAVWYRTVIQVRVGP